MAEPGLAQCLVAQAGLGHGDGLGERVGADLAGCAAAARRRQAQFLQRLERRGPDRRTTWQRHRTYALQRLPNWTPVAQHGLRGLCGAGAIATGKVGGPHTTGRQLYGPPCAGQYG